MTAHRLPECRVAVRRDQPELLCRPAAAGRPGGVPHRRARRLAGIALLVLAAAAATSCSRGAGEDQLRSDLQARLDHDVKPGLLRIAGLRREGSGPLPAGESGAPRVVVYYNTTLELAEDYTFGSWDQLAPSSLAFALGATEKGLFGLEPQNRAGDLIRAYGSAIYEEQGGEWTLITAAPAQAGAAAPVADGEVPPTRSKQMIDRLAALVELPPPGVPPADDEIIADELARASENIERRVQRREHTYTIATGPAGGEYAKFGAALIAAVQELAPAVKLRLRPSEGSVDNVWMLGRGDADYAIVQGDVAAAAVAGTDMFAQGGAIANLRAVGGLFPEAIHVIVPPGSPIRDIGGLRGKRVNVGPAASGTRYDAVAVLAAHDLKVADLAEAREEPIAEAIGRLQRKQIDALFVTAAAPTGMLQELAARTGLRLLPITGPARDRLLLERPGLTPIVLPANTYPRQPHAIETAAASALLVTTSDAPQAEVERVVDVVFTRLPQAGDRSATVLKATPANEHRGVTIPLHPGAGRRSGHD